jgi:hypothetical protein
MTPTRLSPEREKEIREKLGCLIPREGAEVPSCHEYSFCDCTVSQLLAEIDALRAQRDRAIAAGDAAAGADQVAEAIRARSEPKSSNPPPDEL